MKIRVSMLAVVAAAATLSGCGGSEDSTSTPTPTREAAADDIAGVAGTKAFVDELWATYPELKGKGVAWNVAEAGITVCKVMPDRTVARAQMLPLLTRNAVFPYVEERDYAIVDMAVKHICPDKA